MSHTNSFAGMTLTEIFEIQPIQSLLIKFWYLGLTTECLKAPQDISAFLNIRKTITFANCFTFEMPIRTYINFIERINLTLEELNPKKIFEVLLGHLKNNRVEAISFQLFGVAFLQLLGRLLDLINTEIIIAIFRKIYSELTIITKNGLSMMKTNIKAVGKVDFEELIPGLQKMIEQRETSQINLQNQEKVGLNYDRNSLNKIGSDVRTLQGRLQSRKQLNYQMKDCESGAEYPVGDKMRIKERTKLSCFMMGGFQIVDYSQSINELHKKLLTKILLNM